MPAKSAPRPTLRLAFLFLVLFQTAMVGVLGFLVHREWQRDQEAGALTEAVTTRGNGATTALYFTLDDMWQSLRGLSAALGQAPAGSLASHFDALTALGGVSWAGMADLQGKVVAASGDMLIGKDVSSRPWFTGGMVGDYAGDVHEAVLLNTLLGGTEEDPIRFVDFATPVKDRQGRVIGVLGIHVDTRWLEAYLEEMARSLKVDLFLVGADGSVRLGTQPLGTDVLDLPTIKMARSGAQTSGQDAWPDGNRYFTTAVRGLDVGDMPGFGWTVVARIAPDTFAASRLSLTEDVQQILGIAMGIILVGSFLFWRIFLAPIGRLAQAGHQIAQGHLVAPPEETATVEYSELSLAITKLQAKDLSNEPNLRSRSGPIPHRAAG